MMTSDWYINREEFHYQASDVFQWIGDTYPPFQLTNITQQAGNLSGHFRVTWDGLVHDVQYECRASQFTYHKETYEWFHKYYRNTFISRTASHIVKKLPHRVDAFHLAQNLIVSDVFYWHVTENIWKIEGRGQSCKDYSIDLRGQYITVRIKATGKQASFTFDSVVKSIQDQIIQASQQLRLF